MESVRKGVTGTPMEWKIHLFVEPLFAAAIGYWVLSYDLFLGVLLLASSGALFIKDLRNWHDYRDKKAVFDEASKVWGRGMNAPAYCPPQALVDTQNELGWFWRTIHVFALNIIVLIRHRLGYKLFNPVGYYLSHWLLFAIVSWVHSYITGSAMGIQLKCVSLGFYLFQLVTAYLNHWLSKDPPHRNSPGISYFTYLLSPLNVSKRKAPTPSGGKLFPPPTQPLPKAQPGMRPRLRQPQPALSTPTVPPLPQPATPPGSSSAATSATEAAHARILRLPSTGVSDLQELKTLWREGLKRYHPDTLVDPAAKAQAELMTKRLNEAYKHFKAKLHLAGI